MPKGQTGTCIHGIFPVKNCTPCRLAAKREAQTRYLAKRGNGPPLCGTGPNGSPYYGCEGGLDYSREAGPQTTPKKTPKQLKAEWRRLHNLDLISNT